MRQFYECVKIIKDGGISPQKSIRALPRKIPTVGIFLRSLFVFTGSLFFFMNSLFIFLNSLFIFTGSLFNFIDRRTRLTIPIASRVPEKLCRFVPEKRMTPDYSLAAFSWSMALILSFTSCMSSFSFCILRFISSMSELPFFELALRKPRLFS